MESTVSLQELIAAVSEFTNDENEIVATVMHLICSGQVRVLTNSLFEETLEDAA